MTPLRVRFHPAFAYFFLPVSLFILGTGLFLGKPMLIFLGAMQLFIGVQYLRSAIYVVHEREIEVKNLLGMTLKRHTFGGLSELLVEGGKLWHAPPGGTRKSLVAVRMVHPADRDELVRRITAQRALG